MLNVPHIERIVVNERKKYYILYMGAKGMIYVIKKDGTREEFNSQKIVNADPLGTLDYNSSSK